MRLQMLAIVVVATELMEREWLCYSTHLARRTKEVATGRVVQAIRYELTH